MLSCHDRPLAGIGRPVESTAEPENAIWSPAAHVNVGSGDVIVGVGGSPAVIVTLIVSVRPPSSVTRSLTRYRPACVYVWVGDSSVESPNVPSPSRSHE